MTAFKIDPRNFHQYPVLRHYMTPTPHTIGRAQSLTVAGRMMREHGIRHLPVLDGGRLVGLLSERDVLLIETMPNSNPTEVLVEEAMTPDILEATPDTSLAEVIEGMLARKAGSTVAREGEHVVGVFTTVDALRALLDRLAAPA